MGADTGKSAIASVGRLVGENAAVNLHELHAEGDQGGLAVPQRGLRALVLNPALRPR
jgi:hypothetical protein